VRDSLPRVFAWSGFVAEVLRRQGGLLAGDWLRSLHERLPDDALAAEIRAAASGAADEAEPMRVMRRQRQAMTARIAWREIAGWADVEETLAALSAVADACIDVALERLHAWHREAHGEARGADGSAQRL